MSNMYPNNNICEHGAVCIDPAYHSQYHLHNDTHYHDSHHCHCDCCNNSDNSSSNNNDDEVKYNGLPRYDHPHPYPHPKCNHYCNHKYTRTLLRDEEVGNIIRVESRIMESLLIKLYSCIADKDVTVKMELGMKYTIKWIDADGVNTCTGILTDFKASQHSIIYQPTNADGYYIVMDCSEVGKSDIKKILIASIRDIIEVSSDDNIITIPDSDKIEEALSIAYSYGQLDNIDNKMWVIDQMVRVLCKNEDDYKDFITAYEMQVGDEKPVWNTGVSPIVDNEEENKSTDESLTEGEQASQSNEEVTDGTITQPDEGETSSNIDNEITEN